MSQRIARVAAVGLCLAACHGRSHPTPPPAPSPDGGGVIVNSIPGLPADFMMGADVSMLAQLEASGAIFSDEAGVPGDALRILRDHGVNWVRLRLWNTPSSPGRSSSPVG